MGGPETMAAQAAMQVVQGIAQRGQMRAEARALDENARVTETQGGYDAIDALRASRAAMGDELTGAAGSGTGLDGSVADLLRAQAVENQMEAMSVRANAGMKADGLRSQARARRKQGDWALITGAMSAGAAAIKLAGEDRATGKLRAATLRDTRSRVPQATGTIPLPPKPTIYGGEWDM